MEFISPLLANKPSDLPRLDRVTRDGIVWRIAARVLVNGREHMVCLGFTPEDLLMSISIAPQDGSGTVAPFSSYNASDMLLISRTTAEGKLPGISIRFLLDYAEYLEGVLADGRAKCETKDCIHPELFQSVDGDTIAVMPQQMRTLVCATTWAAREFFASLAFGGSNSMSELADALEWAASVMRALWGESPGTMDGFAADVRELQLMKIDDWRPAHYDRQRYITGYVLTFVRMVEILRRFRAPGSNA